MMKNVIVFFATVLIFSCANMAEDKVPEIADDYCKCFSAKEKALSKKTKKFVALIAEGERDEQVIADERAKLSEEELADFTEFFTSLQDKNSKVTKCIAKVDKKLEKLRTKDKDKFLDKLVDEMESRQNCKMAAYVFKMGQEELKKKADNNDTEEEEE